MPYVRRYRQASRRRYTPYRKTYKRYGKKYGRPRFKRKFTKSYGKVSGTLMSRNLNVKLPFSEIIPASLGASGSVRYYWIGNGLCPRPTGSNPNIPEPAPGDKLVNGAIEYAQFYSKAVCHGSSIRIQLVNGGGPAGTSLRSVLIAMPYDSDLANKAMFSNRLSELDAMSYEQLCAVPYARCKLSSLGTGGSASIWYKMFRKTKTMCGVKDVVDNDDMELMIPYDNLDSWTTNQPNPNQGFFYYLKIYNRATDQAIPIDVSVNMKFYYQLSDRVPIPQVTLVEP